MERATETATKIDQKNHSYALSRQVVLIRAARGGALSGFGSAAVRCGAVRCGVVVLRTAHVCFAVWCGAGPCVVGFACVAVWCGAVRSGAVRCGAVRFGAVRSAFWLCGGVVQCGMLLVRCLVQWVGSAVSVEFRSAACVEFCLAVRRDVPVRQCGAARCPVLWVWQRGGVVPCVVCLAERHVRRFGAVRQARCLVLCVSQCGGVVRQCDAVSCVFAVRCVGVRGRCGVLCGGCCSAAVWCGSAVRCLVFWQCDAAVRCGVLCCGFCSAAV